VQGEQGEGPKKEAIGDLLEWSCSREGGKERGSSELCTVRESVSRFWEIKGGRQGEVGAKKFRNTTTDPRDRRKPEDLRREKVDWSYGGRTPRKAVGEERKRRLNTRTKGKNKPSSLFAFAFLERFALLW